MSGLFIGAAELGLIYAVMSLGIYITYKILDFPDLTVDGSFPLGGAVTAVALHSGIPPLAACLLALAAGAAAGFLTGVIHVKLRVRGLLSGIIMMTGLYSVNFLIAGKANLPITREMPTVFTNDFFTSLFGNVQNPHAPLSALSPYKTLAVLLLFVIAGKVLLDLFFRTKQGYLLRAVGDNPALVATLARNGGNVKILGLTIANALVALAGSLFCQHMKAFNLTDGTGKVVVGLAAVIIGINLFGRIRFFKNTTAVVLGSLIYTACVSLALTKFDANVKNLVTAAFFLLVLVLGQHPFKKRRNRR